MKKYIIRGRIRPYRKRNGAEPGRTRIKLAKMLEALYLKNESKKIIVPPIALDRNNPIHASAQFDGCSWEGWGYLPEMPDTPYIHFTSWDSMGECVKYGIDGFNDRGDYDISSMKK